LGTVRVGKSITVVMLMSSNRCRNIITELSP
jgi:hypothetical protein